MVSPPVAKSRILFVCLFVFMKGEGLLSVDIRTNNSNVVSVGPD